MGLINCMMSGMTSSAGARPGNFVDLPPQAVDQKGSIYVPYAGELPAAARTIPDIQQAVVARLRNRDRATGIRVL